MSDETAGGDGTVTDKERLAFERYKAQLDYRKFVLGSVFAAITIAAIPPLFQLGGAVLEYVKGQAEISLRAQQFRDSYVKEFLNTALNQDIELRIRFAQYFSSVSSDKEHWAKYLNDLTTLRKTKRSEIDSMEDEWHKVADVPRPDVYAVNTLKRHLDWAYSEVGYAAPNRSSIANPRAPDDSKGPGLSLTSIPPNRRDIAQKILDAFAAAGFGQFQQVAALANAIAESGLNPDIRLAAGGEDSWGLFLLNRNGGLGTGHTPEELKNPDVNIRIVVERAKKEPTFAASTSLDDAVDVFVRRIEIPGLR